MGQVEGGEEVGGEEMGQTSGSGSVMGGRVSGGNPRENHHEAEVAIPSSGNRVSYSS